MDFYYMDISSPCRAVMLVAKAVGVELNKKVLDILKKEQLNPEFIAINPLHTIPTLVDGDLKLWESRVICTYLASQYGKDDSLYPKDPKTRAQIDKLLYFDLATLYRRFGDYFYPAIQKKEDFDPEKLELLHEALGWLDGFLNGHDFVVGNSLTVADYVLVASVANFIVAGIDISKNLNVKNWVKRCQTQMEGYDAICEKGLREFGDWMKGNLK